MVKEPRPDMPLTIVPIIIVPVKVMIYSFQINLYCVQAGTRTIDLELTTLSSTHHVELNPSDAGFQDRYIVQEIIKEMAKSRPIDTKGKKGFKGNSLTSDNNAFFHVVCC